MSQVTDAGAVAKAYIVCALVIVINRVPAVVRVFVVCLVAAPLPETAIPEISVPAPDDAPSSRAFMVVVALVKLVGEDISYIL